jgi:mono/diheme cytochrome c family protein/azurin
MPAERIEFPPVMRHVLTTRGLRAAGGGILVLAATTAAHGCSLKEDNPDLVAGKRAFVQKCGSCHALRRAGTKGTVGPDLDQAFQQAEKEGFGESAIRGVIKKQILFPARGGVMPANLATGEQADDISAYVAKVVARPGKDAGLLATAVQPAGSGKPVAAKNGVLSIAADPTGQLAFVAKQATAPAGALTIEMPNESGVPHDLTIDGKGKTATVTNGKPKFQATFAAGKYTYYCSVPGHRAAGMEGTLTVQ